MITPRRISMALAIAAALDPTVNAALQAKLSRTETPRGGIDPARRNGSREQARRRKQMGRVG